MVNYPLNGQNKVSVVDFSSSVPLCRGVNIPENIESCINQSFEAILADNSIDNSVKELSITMTWTCMTDLDVWITEPSGNRIGYSNMKSPTGGELDLDQLATVPSAHGYAENIAWSDAPTGNYELHVNTYRACTTGHGCCTGSPYSLVLNQFGRRKTFHGVVGGQSQWDHITTFYHQSNMNAATSTELYNSALTESIDFVAERMILQDFKNVAIIFNDEIPNQRVKDKFERESRLDAVTGFGIGEKFQSQNAQYQLASTFQTESFDSKKYIVKDFDEFEENRLNLQNTICSAD